MKVRKGKMRMRAKSSKPTLQDNVKVLPSLGTENIVVL